MMLGHAQRIVVPDRQVWLEILLDVVSDSELLAKLDHSMGIALPVCGLRNFQVVRAADLVQINEAVGLSDDLQTRLDIDRRLQADPGKDAGLMEGSQGLQAVSRERRAALPPSRKVIIEAGESRSKSVTVTAEQLEVAEAADSSLGQGTKAEAMFNQNLNALGCQRRVAGVIRVRRET